MTPDTVMYAIWIVWLLVWLAGAWRTKAPTRVDGVWRMLAYHGPLAVGYVLMFALRPGVGAGGHWLLRPFLPPSALLAWAGVAMLACGLVLACWARAVLGRNWSATVQLKQDHQLVTAGPYRRVRHPIYSGILLGLAGSALTVDAWRGVLALAIVAASFAYKLRHEEAWMRERFGEVYVAYMQRTKALIPGIW